MTRPGRSNASGCARVLAVGCGSVLAAIAVLTLLAVWASARSRRVFEERYQSEIGPIELPRKGVPSGVVGENAALEVRAAVSDAGALEAVDDELKRLLDIGAGGWTEANRAWIRAQAEAFAGSWAALDRARQMPRCDFELDLRAISLGEEKEDNLIPYLRLARLARVVAAEAEGRGDVSVACASARRLLTAARCLSTGPLEIYRMIGHSVERSGLVIVHGSVARFSSREASDVSVDVTTLAQLPDHVALRHGDSMAFYLGGIERVGLAWVPDDLVRAIWLRCELQFAVLERSDLDAARDLASSIHASKDPRDAVCKKFSDSRLELAILDALMQRARRITLAALSVRKAVEPIEAQEVASWRPVLRLPDEGVQLDRLPDGSTVVSDPGLARLAREFTTAKVPASFETLSEWRVPPADPVREPPDHEGAL